MINEGRLPADAQHPVFYEGAAGMGRDAVPWWFDLLHSRRARDQEMHSLILLITNHPEVLVEHRRERVITLLSETTRGAGRFTSDALVGVLQVVGRCAPLEDRWSAWIRDGLIDGRHLLGSDPSTAAPLHVELLERCVDEGPFPRDWALIDETTAHWREMLGDPAHRDTALHRLAQVMLDGRALLGRLPDAVLPALVGGTAEARAVQEGFHAVARGRRQHAADIATALLDRLRD